MNKLYLYFFFITCLNFAQTIKGKITNNLNNPISNCIVTLKYNKNIIDFVQTDSLGEFIFEDLKEHTYTLEIEHEKYIKKVFQHSPSNQFHTISLENSFSNAKTIEEVVIKKEQYIIQKKDTTIFDVKGLKKIGDNVVEDLLKRLPEVSVGKDGSVFYKGKEIKSLTIDGDDVFNEKYTHGTKNINLNLVEKIEAIENYNSNEITRGIQKTNEVSINLKTNKTISYNITTDLKTDFYKEYEGSLFGLLLKKNKGYAYVNKNNIGKIVNDNVYKFLVTNKIQELVLENGITDFNNAIYYNYHNNQNLISSNYLIKANKKTTNNIGLSFKNDNINRNSEQFIDYLNESDNYNSFSYLNSKPKSYGIENSFEYNINKQIQFENITKIIHDKVDQNNDELRNGILFYRKNHFEKMSFYNTMAFSYKASNQLAMSVKYIYFNSKWDQEFNNNTGNNSNYNFNYLLKNRINKISYNLFYHKNKSSWINYSLDYTTTNYNINIDSKKFSQLNSIISYYKKFKKISLDTKLTTIQYFNIPSAKSTFLLPEIKIKYSLAKKWSIFSLSSSEIRQPIPLSFFTNPISTYSDNITTYNNLEFYKKYSNNITLSYLDLFNTRSISVSFGKNYKTGDLYIYNKFINNIFTKNYLFINQPNYDLNFEIDGKNYFYFLKTTITLKYSYNHIKSYYLKLNEMIPILNKQNTFEINFQKDFLKKINITENFNFTTINSISESNKNNSKNIQNTFTSKYQINEKIFLSFEYIQIQPNLSQKYYYHFLNSTLTYKLKNKIEINFTGVNLFNNTAIYNYYQSNNSISTTSNSIHERTILLGVKYVI